MIDGPAIEVRHLTKDFRVGLRGVKLRAVDDVSLSIPRGQVFGLLGPNGCGKSTTLKVVLGLLPATAGEVTILGQPSATASATVAASARRTAAEAFIAAQAAPTSGGKCRAGPRFGAQRRNSWNNSP